ncbi:MAG TPA: SusC/RagA family TonB-linked outer membrane protein [Cytophagales bacterium]|nr:SusC/RagA family TonB-linked outer membrane protein [Cytophagales bacterium]
MEQEAYYQPKKNMMENILRKKIDVWKQKSYRCFYVLVLVSLTINVALETKASNLKMLSSRLVEHTVSGKVTDGKGEILPGVSVVVKGTTVGTTTDVQGNYSLTTTDAQVTLVFSYIGFTTQEVAVDGRNVVDVTLKEDIEALSEVVVVGYGTQEKRQLTSAVVTVGSKDLQQGAFNSPLQMLEGKVAGLTISNPGAGDPNRGTDVQIRGASSFKAGNGPLIVIDGMPGGDLRNIAQQDIESISVLKDGAAAAIYGSRGANGVILVQTKRGKAGKVSVTYDSYIEHDQIAASPDVLSAEQFLERGRDIDFGARTNWYNELIRKNNMGQNHFLAIGGGSESTQFRISGNYKTKQGIDIASGRKEYGFRLNFLQKALDNFVEFGGNISYRIANEDLLGTDLGSPSNNYGAFTQAVKLNPTIPIMDPNNPTRYNNLMGYDTYNPVQSLKTRDLETVRNYSIIDFNVKLNLLKNLNTELKLARQGNDMLLREYYSGQSSESINGNFIGRARQQSEKWTDYTLEWLGNYSTRIKKHDIKLMGGYSYQEFNNEGLWAQNRRFPSDAFGYNNLGEGNYGDGQPINMNDVMDSWKSKEKTIAFLGRVNYNFDDTYFLTASVRYEGNTKFGPNNKTGIFPGFSAAWRLSNLGFLENANFVDDLKLRMSYGMSGRSGFDRYTALPKYQGYGRYQNDDGQWIRVYGPGNNYNPDLRWEKQVSYNLGLDFAFLGNRVSGSVDAFLRKSSDLINDYLVPVPPYLHDRMFVNVGTQSARGIELSLDLDVVQTKGFTYTTSVTGSYAKSRMDKFSNDKFKADFRYMGDLPSPGNPGPAYRLEEGAEIGSFWGYKYAGVDESGKILVWKNAEVGGEKIVASTDADANRDKTFIGNGMPRYELGWNNRFAYAGIDLTLFFRGKFDYDIMNLYQMYYGLTAEPNVNLIEDAYGRNAHITSGKVITDYFLEKGDFFRLDNLTLGWNPKFKINKINNLRIYGTIRNVFTWTKYSGLDPTAVGVTGLEPGMGSLNVYPVTRNFALGLQIGL